MWSELMERIGLGFWESSHIGYVRVKLSGALLASVDSVNPGPFTNHCCGNHREKTYQDWFWQFSRAQPIEMICKFYIINLKGSSYSVSDFNLPPPHKRPDMVKFWIISFIPLLPGISNNYRVQVLLQKKWTDIVFTYVVVFLLMGLNVIYKNLAYHDKTLKTAPFQYTIEFFC